MATKKPPSSPSEDPKKRSGRGPGRTHAWIWSGSAGRETDSIAEIEKAYASGRAKLWVDLVDPDEQSLGELARCLGVHPLVVEDILERDQRAKFELTDDVAHIVMFALRFEREIIATEIDFVLAKRYLISAHGADWDPLAGDHVRHGVFEYLKSGPDHLLWALVDPLVDGYFPVFDKLSDEIDELQALVIERPDRWVVERLFQVRRDLLTIRHAITPQREVFNQLTNRELPLVQPEKVIYFRDVYDHLIRLTDELDTHRELVTTTLEAYLSTVNNNLSEVMKRLTAATVILAGVGAVAGIFGMSEAGLALDFGEAPGFWIVTVGVVLVGVGAFAWFRRIGWL